MRALLSRLRSSAGSGPAQLLAVAAVFLVGRSTVVGYSDWASVRAMAVLASFLGIAAMGHTLVVLAGGIDLSVPALIGAGNVMTARLTGEGWSSPPVIASTLAAGFAVGAVNGYVTSRWRAPALVVTLATASVVGGAVLLWTDASLSGQAPAWLASFTSSAADTGPLPIAPVVVAWLLLAAVAEFALRRTIVGRRLYVHGVNPDVARLMLVSDHRVTTFAFACSGLLAALSGTLLTGFTGSGLFDVGSPYLFSAIAAVVVGGNSLLGGRGNILRCVLGTVALTELTTLLVGYSLGSAAQQAVLGAVILAVVATYGREQPLGSRI
ncbi:ABC transporter permease [Streptomyces sp. TS71-3]|uniref:ABC transporter permease n=1 Tax=Streptomyces sp. TS71-3 TaxID=2733862 RepID=UPI001B0B048D|nr:ABC transporter permease [Streptomyces sp. TS71-3]GHJ38475.1 ABC transporter permease [Streptomyces sp. TS71-3]